MRPKKVVLLVDCSPASLSVRKFFLSTRGFLVITAANANEARHAVVTVDIDAVIVEHRPGELDADAIVRILKDTDPLVRTMITSTRVRPGELAHTADCFMGANSNSPAELYDGLKVLSMRKRGPRTERPIAAERLG